MAEHLLHRGTIPLARHGATSAPPWARAHPSQGMIIRKEGFLMTAPVPNAASEKIKKNALIAMIVGFVCGGVLPGVLGLLGYLKADQEPETARKFTKWAWIVFAICWVLAIIFIVIYVIVIFSVASSGMDY